MASKHCATLPPSTSSIRVDQRSVLLVLIVCLTSCSTCWASHDCSVFTSLSRPVDVTYTDFTSINTHWPFETGASEHDWISLTFEEQKLANLTTLPESILYPDQFGYVSNEADAENISVELFTHKDLPNLKEKLIRATIQVDDWQLFYSDAFFAFQSSYNLVRHEVLFGNAIVAIASYRRPQYTLRLRSLSNDEPTELFRQTFNNADKNDTFNNETAFVREWGTHYISEATYGYGVTTFYMLKPRQSNVTSLDNIKKSVQYLFAQKLIEAKMQKEVELFEPECQAGECFEMVENSTFAYGGTLDANSKKQMLIVNDSLSLSEWFKCVASDPRKWQIISCRLAPLSDYIDYDQRDYYDQVYYNYYLNAIRYEIGRLLPQKSNACGSFHRVVQQELTSLDLEMEQLVVENGTLPNYRTLFEKFNRLLSTVHLIDYNKINIEQEEEWVQWTDHKLNFFLCNCVPETRNATFEEQFDLIKNKLQNEKESLEKLEKSNHDLEFCKRLFDDVQSDGIDTNSPHIKDFLTYYSDHCKQYDDVTCGSISLVLTWSLIAISFGFTVIVKYVTFCL